MPEAIVVRLTNGEQDLYRRETGKRGALFLPTAVAREDGSLSIRSDPSVADREIGFYPKGIWLMWRIEDRPIKDP